MVKSGINTENSNLYFFFWLSEHGSLLSKSKALSQDRFSLISMTYIYHILPDWFPQLPCSSCMIHVPHWYNILPNYPSNWLFWIPLANAAYRHSFLDDVTLLILEGYWCTGSYFHSISEKCTIWTNTHIILLKLFMIIVCELAEITFRPQ